MKTKTGAVTLGALGTLLALNAAPSFAAPQKPSAVVSPKVVAQKVVATAPVLLSEAEMDAVTGRNIDGILVSPGPGFGTFVSALAKLIPQDPVIPSDPLRFNFGRLVSALATRSIPSDPAIH